MKTFIIIFFVLVYSCCAQSDSTNRYKVSERQLFGNFGIGEGTIGFNLTTGIQLINNSHTFTGRYIYSREGKYYDITPPLQEDDNGHPVPFLHEFSFMYGYTKIFSYEKFPASLIQIHGGIGMINGSTFTVRQCLPEIFGCEYDEIKHTAIGFAYSVQIIQKINKRFGIGAQFYGNLNNSLKINGTSLSIYFGKMY